MIKLSNGHCFEYMAASGALAFDGKGWIWEVPLKWLGLINPLLFTVVIKTLTLQPRRGNLRWYNPFRCVRFLKGGIVNAVGLTNPGINWWCQRIGPRINLKGPPLIGSILGEPNELVELAKMLNGYPLVGLEINASCPNTTEDILTNIGRVIASCEAVKKVSRFPLLLKFSVVHDFLKIVPKVQGLIEAFSINSVPWNLVFPGQESPLAKFGGGGVSGKIVQPYTWKMVGKLSVISSIPVIGPSVWDFEDIATLRQFGASAISFGSVFIPYPWRPTLFAKRDQSQLTKRKELAHDSAAAER